MAHLSITAAILGKTSQIWMPATLVGIGLNSPRISTGASVLMSHMSWWGGPPPRKMLITALWDSRCTGLGLAAKNVGQSQSAGTEPERADLEETASRNAIAKPGLSSPQRSSALK